jgi:glyoxylase-like metal-dependent hydrolase (beta-lactamase superfamily II)
MNCTFPARILIVLFLLASVALAQAIHHPERKIARLAEGVYEIEHPDALPDFPEGNTTVVIGDRAVFVVDSGYLPSTTRKDIEQIRHWTDKPVRYLMLTHGHTDHTTGNGIYAREFPGLTIIAHAQTRKLMERYTPGYPDLFTARTAELQKTLDAGADSDKKPLNAEDISELKREISARQAIDSDIHSMGENAFPNLTLANGEIGFDLGHREVQVKFLGRGNTAGDVVAYLPSEKIAIVGDILVHPVPYTCSGFPVDWASTLDHLAALQPAVIVPGHGEVMHDLTYLNDMRALLWSVISQVDGIFKAIPGGGQASLERAQKAVDVSAFRDKFPSGDQYNPKFFDRTLYNCLVRNVYYQLAPR